jgi:hypothetical protein
MDPIPISSAKQQANQANARHSTGPKTPQGKAVSAMNSRTHGFCSPALLLPGEDPDEFDQFKQEYSFQIDPSTPLERTLFEELFAAAWKLRRLQRLETTACSQTESFEALLDDDQLQKKLDNLARHKARIERSFYRALKELKFQQTNRAIVQLAVQAPLPFPDQADAKLFSKRTQAPSRTEPQPAPAPASMEADFAKLDDLFLPKQPKEDPEAA